MVVRGSHAVLAFVAHEAAVGAVCVGATACQKSSAQATCRSGSGSPSSQPLS
jgi:hypothetical protein